MSKTMTRRRVIGAGLAVAAAGNVLTAPALAADEGALDIPRLIAATNKLLGQRPADPFFAGRVFAHIISVYPADSLNRLSDIVQRTEEKDLASALTQGGLIKMASDIANMWYSGTIYTEAEEQQVIGYVDNMAWQAIEFSTPQSICGGHFGHWHKIPTGQ